MASAFEDTLNTSSKLLLLCGSGHNGSTILARLLLGHPAISGELSETFAFGLTHEQLWPGVLEQLALGAGEPPWVLEKTPLHLYNSSRLLEVFATSRCILLMRDGREVVASLARRSYSMQAALQRWTAAAREIILLRSQFPNRTLLVRYEDLVSSPRSQLHRISSFLSISASPLFKAAKSTANVSYLGNYIKPSQNITTSFSPDQIDDRLPHALRRALQVSMPLGQPRESGWLKLTDEQRAMVGSNDDFRFYIKLFRYSDWRADNLES